MFDLEMFNTLEQSCSWTVRWYRILSSRRPLPDFIPADVEVVCLEVPEEEVWNREKQGRARRAQRQQFEQEPSDAEHEPEEASPGAAAEGQLDPNLAIADGGVSAAGNDNDARDASSSGESDEAFGESGDSHDDDGHLLEDELDDAESAADSASELSQSDCDSSSQDDPPPPGAPEFGSSDVWREVAPEGVPDALPHPPEVVPPPGNAPGGSNSAGHVDNPRPRARAADARVQLPNGSLISFYSSTASFEAVCGTHAEDGNARCRLTRTCMPAKHASRKGQGRPLGILAAWCCIPQNLSLNAGEHRDPLIICQAKDMARRKLARASLKQCPGYEALAAFERARADGEESEPECIP
jgi:hypothetical protein